MTGIVRAHLGGGIGSGKSTAAGVFGGLGAAVLSADGAARAVLEPGGAGAAAVEALWPEVVDGGRIDRSALARIVFADPAARIELEAITHPLVGRLLAERVAETQARVVLVEMPLPIDLLGPGWRWVVVDAPDEVRLARLLSRGMEAADALSRMAAQPSRDEWMQRADVVVDNGAGFDHLEIECRRAWRIIGGWQGPEAR